MTEHWLSRKPCNIPNEIWSARATAKVREAWAAQAKADWRAFLQHRALEMQPSARLLIIGSGANQQGDSGAEGLLDLANSVLQQLVNDGTLYPNEYEEMAIPTYYRTAQEWKDPLLLIRTLVRRQPSTSIVLKNLRCPMFISNGSSRPVTLRHSRKRTLVFSKRHSNRACS